MNKKSEQRRMPVRIARIDLAGDYEGWWADMRINPPFWVFESLSSDDLAEMKAALSSLIKAWNFVDEDGIPLTDPDVYRKEHSSLSKAADILTAIPKDKEFDVQRIEAERAFQAQKILTASLTGMSACPIDLLEELAQAFTNKIQKVVALPKA